MSYRASSFTVIIVFALLILCGLPLVYLLDIKLNPEARSSSLTIRFAWNGAEPRVIEQEATAVLEALTACVQGIKKISSKSGRGAGVVNVTLDKNADFDAIRFELSTLIRQAWSEMPQGTGYPVITVNRPDDESTRPLLSYTLNAPASPAAVQKYADLNFKPALASVRGIYVVEVYGASPMEWIITYDIMKMNPAGITPGDITSAVTSVLQRVEAGTASLTDGGGVIQLVIRSRFYDGNSLLQLPVKKTEGRIVRLGDIASITHQEEERQSIYRINGLNTINILVYAAKGKNNLTVAGEVKSVIATLESSLPTGYKLLLTDDSTKFIFGELLNIGLRTLFTFVILLLFVLIVTRRLKYVLLIMMMLIGNLSIAVIFYYLFRLEIHLYALAGVTVSLGLMTDNIIIMTDHLRTRGNRKAFLAILAGTLATVSSLIIVFFLGEEIKANLVDFAMVVIINQSVSLLTALFVIPALMSRLKLDRVSLPPPTPSARRRRRRMVRWTSFYKMMVTGIRRRRGWAIAVLILGFGLPLYLLPDSLEGEKPWHRIYNATFGNRFYADKVKPVVGRVTGGALRLFTEKVYEGSYFGMPQETYLNITASMQRGTTLKQADETVARMEQYLLQFSEISTFRTEMTSREASITVYFKKEHQRSSFPYILKSDVIGKAVEIGGAYWNVMGFGDPFSNTVYEGTGRYYIQILGYNYDKLYTLAEELKSRLMLQPRNTEVFIVAEPTWRKPDNIAFTVKIDKERVLASGLKLAAVTGELRDRSLYQPAFAVLRTPDGAENLRLRQSAENEEDIWTVSRSPAMLDSLFYRLLPVSSIVMEATTPVISKTDQQYVLYLQFDYIGSEKTARRHINENVTSFQQQLPLGYLVTAGPSQFYWWQQQDKSHYWLLGLIVIIIFFICAILFESLLQPFAVILTIPVAYIGIFLTFCLFKINFDQGGFAALIMLSGITVNAAIYILNDYNILRHSRKNGTQHDLSLYLKAFTNKIIPILLTVASTVLGFIPFLIGEKQPFWFALAAGTIGGLIFSLLGIVFFLPLFIGMGPLQRGTRNEQVQKRHNL